MSQVWTFKCPACGNSLEYVPGTQSLKCPFCGRTATAEEIQGGDTPPSSGPRTAYKEYHCQNCGAQIVTEDTTAATRCYFCHSPVVLSDRLSDEFRPDGILPFELDRERALLAFRTYLKKKHFLDRRFLSDEQLEMFSGIYYPYWIGEIQGDALFEGEGTRVSTAITGHYQVTRTRFFRVSKAAHILFANLQRKALKGVDGKLSDGIHPFHTESVKPFSMAYLSGFLAEKRDVEEQEAAADMLREVEAYVPGMMKKGETYQSLSGNTGFRQTSRNMRYILLPAWVLTFQGRKQNEPYYYMMNGQTGTVCGKLPLDRKKLILVSLLIGAGLCALLCLGGALIW